ncbi:hypothetical protein BGZ61DRAFT_480347 [Ilyonectria robusta]|uniref:uncharacterized protein n=1 Tax=Ilyonectria robusta TaxID=1079257 RepID=UPI001E8D729C|nr:uncharacterized protein BGZ61DRAFT_480347 [Ilyonectria robusta]KAH8684072.1 hypothetical protein BGZ61DRAFT_480347 [Ilyonectria robusta]
MRLLSIAVAALGLLRVGEASRCKPDTTGLSTNAATPTSTPYAPPVIGNPNFAVDLEEYEIEGKAQWVEDGQDGAGDGACQLEDGEEDESALEKRQSSGGSSISTIVRRLTPRTTYTIKFYYYVRVARPANSCRLQASFNGNNFATSERFGSAGSSWVPLSGTINPTSSSGVLKISLTCQFRGYVSVYVDSLTVTRGTLVTSSSSTIASSTSSSVVSSAVSSTESAGVSSTESTDVSSSLSTDVSSSQSTDVSASQSAASASSTASAETTPGASSSDVSSTSGASSSDASSTSGASTDASSTPGASSSDASSTLGATSSDASSSIDTSSTPGASSSDASSTPGASSSADVSSTPGASSSDVSSTPGASTDASSTSGASTDASSTPGASSSDVSTTPGASSSADATSTPSASSSDASSSYASTTPGASSSTDVSSTPGASTASDSPSSDASTTPGSTAGTSSGTASSDSASNTPSTTPGASSSDSSSSVTANNTPTTTPGTTSSSSSSVTVNNTPSTTPGTASSSSSGPASSDSASTTPGTTSSSSSSVTVNTPTTTPGTSSTSASDSSSSVTINNTPTTTTPGTTSSSSASLSANNTPTTTPGTTSSSIASTTPSSTSSSTTSSLPSATIDSTILIIARDDSTAAIGSLGLLAYGIPYEYLIVPQAGVELPVLNSSRTAGNYGGIVVLDSVSYDYGSTGWRSALDDAQWTVIHAYQADFSVRMVRINDYPGVNSGTVPVAGGCCDAGNEQSVFFSDVSDFPTANIKAKAEVGTTGLYHVPATITDDSTTKAVAKFGTAVGFDSETVAAVINNFNGREQFVWFMSWAPAWSLTSAFLEHSHIHWMTRGLFLGKRKIHLGVQIDDVQLSTEPYFPAGLEDVKITTDDLEAHILWQNDLAGRLPAGSEFWLELGHNGNGDLIDATAVEGAEDICNPPEAVDYEYLPDPPHEWLKPIGSGEDQWPASFAEYSWTEECAALDDFAAWFMVPENRDQFGHISHTFTHLNLNNATYKDTAREIRFNQAWMKQLGIDQGIRYSPNGIIPPQITGLFNGDALKAWLDNDILYVVGDNTRPQTRYTDNPYWPLITTTEANGYDGVVVIPRFATRIYYNCHTPACNLEEWIVTSAGTGDFYNLLKVEKESVIRNLLMLQSDPYMFHQANMYMNEEPLTIGDQTGSMSLVRAWTETVVQQLMALTNWPIKSITQDDMAHYFLDRKTVDLCNPKLSYAFTEDGTSIKSVTVTADGNTCGKPIPVTIPSGSASASGGSVSSDVVGTEPPIQWVTLSGEPVTLTLSTPVAF